MNDRQLHYTYSCNVQHRTLITNSKLAQKTLSLILTGGEATSTHFEASGLKLGPSSFNKRSTWKCQRWWRRWRLKEGSHCVVVVGGVIGVVVVRLGLETLVRLEAARDGEGRIVAFVRFPL